MCAQGGGTLESGARLSLVVTTPRWLYSPPLAHIRESNNEALTITGLADSRVDYPMKGMRQQNLAYCGRPCFITHYRQFYFRRIRPQPLEQDRPLACVCTATITVPIWKTLEHGSS